jgi:MoaA/NifB/PqqE/SkfB family radical SAM enzyme
MKNNKKSNAEYIYINEIIRINYKCNWSCKFCNVLKTNNFWEKDISSKEVIYKILSLTKKYSKKQLKNLILSFSWGEPTLNKNLLSFIKLAKDLGIWVVEIQTNWTKLFKEKGYINRLVKAWLDEIFLAQHSWDNEINRKLWSYFNIDDFKNWVKYLKKNNIKNKISIYLNIVITRINLFSIYEYIKLLLNIGFIDIIPERHHNNGKITHKISFWLVQPNWYAEINKEEVLLKFSNDEITEIKKIVDLCEKNNILPDFHFTSPPLCILNYPEYNLEYSRLKKLRDDEKKWTLNEWNLESYKWLWKEKQKFEECKKCKYNDYCLWFYKNWIKFVWENYVKDKINIFLGKK